MHTYEEAKEMLHRELEEIVKKGELSAGSLETVDKLLNSIKNACKIMMYDEFDEGYSQEGGMGGSSYAQRRDSRGRYSRAGGYSNESAYANARGGGGRGGSRGGGSRGGYSRAGGYSYDDGNEEKVEILREMMNEANSEDERRVLNKLIRRMENE